MTKIRSPIVWFGGKHYMRKKLIPILESIPHTRYIEPFGGGASILIAKKPVSIETYNDIDEGLYDFFTVMSDPELFDRFTRIVYLLPSSRQMYNEYRNSWMDEPDQVKRVAMWYLVTRQSFSGHHSWAVTVNQSRAGMAKAVSSWLGIHRLLPDIHARLQRVQIENKSFDSVISQQDHADALFYCDPPYVASTRKSGKYAHEMSDEQHESFIDLMLSSKGKFVVSGYPNDIYDKLTDNQWHVHAWDTVSSAAARTDANKLKGKGQASSKQKRTECVWVSPNALESLYMKGLINDNN